MRHRLSLLLAAAAVLVACVPVPTRTVPGSEPVFYSGPKAEVFATVLQAITTSPGLDDSNGWIVTQSDSAGGFIRAETSVEIRAGLLQIPQGRFNHYAVSVAMSAAGESRTQVVIQGTRRAEELMARVAAALTQKFGVSN